MKKYILLIIALLFLVGCTPIYSYPAATSESGQSIAAIGSPRPTATPSLTPTATENPYLEISVKQTAVALEQIKLEQDLEKIQADQAALNIQLTIDSATSTSQAAITQTAQAQTNSTSTAIAAVIGTKTAVALMAPAATRTAKVDEQQYRATVIGIWLGRIILWGIGIVILCGLVYAGYVGIRGLHFKMSQMKPDENGRFNSVAEDAIPGKGKRILNPNLAHRALVGSDTDDLTAEQALINTQAQRQLEATRAIVQSPVLMRKLMSGKQQLPAGSEATMPLSDVTISKPGINYLTNGNIVAPSFSMFDSWDGKGGIPYGVSAEGLERVSIQQVPHVGVFGQTGKGKSRYFLRPGIAGAIAAGQRVVIIGKQADFWPFANHPNVKMIQVRHITQEDEAARYAGHLKRIVEEMNRRDDYLTANHFSTWDRAGRENTLIVLDELGNALDMMPREIAQEAHRWVQGLVKEGRKAGFNVWLASQRAVGFKSIVEQLGRAVFYLADADASRHALGFPGAEQLSDGHFYAKFHGVRKCVAFDPTDEELVNFLKSRTVKAHEPIDWIEGEVVGEAVGNQPAMVGENVETRIRRVLERMQMENKVSLSQCQREVFGESDPRGGKHFVQVQEVYMGMKAAERATATGNMPDSGLIPDSATDSAV